MIQLGFFFSFFMPAPPLTKYAKYFCVGINAYFRLVRAIAFAPLCGKIWRCDKYTLFLPVPSWLSMKGEEHFRRVDEPESYLDDNSEEKRKHLQLNWEHESISRALFKCCCEFYSHKTPFGGAACMWLLLPSATTLLRHSSVFRVCRVC